jgi:vitamin B12 transporter
MFFRKFVLASVAAPALLGAQAAPRDTLAAAVITATRVAVTTVAPTATTSVIRGEDLRAQGITRVADALRLIPGAIVLGSGPVGSQTSLFLRGGNSNYVRVLIDGVPVNDAGGFIDLANFTTSNIDRIEVVRGPASVLYGSEAVTGVIQLFTRDGGGARTMLALAGGGSDGAQRAELGASGKRSGARYSIDAAHQATDGILAYNNKYTTDVLSGSLALKPTTVTDVRVAARWSGAIYQYPTDYSGQVNDRNAEQVDHRLTASVDAGYKLSDRVESRISLTSNEFLPRSNDGPDTKADTFDFYGFYSRSVRTRRAADLRFNIKSAARHTLSVGAEVARDREASTSLSLSQYGNTPDAFEVARHNTGIYAQSLGDLNDRWSYVVGARIDENSAFGSHTTGRANLAWLAGANTRLRAAFGTAFKAPSFFENFAAGYVKGNPDLKPEESQGFEVAMDAVLDDGLFALTVAAYAQQFRNIVQYAGTAPSPGAPNYFNVAGASANGVEVDGRYQLEPEVSLAIHYAYTATNVTDAGFDKSAAASYVKGSPLLRRPKHSVGGSITRTWEHGGSFRAMLTRVGARDDRDFTVYPAKAITMQPHTRIDLATIIPVGISSVRAQLRAENILGAEYEEVVKFQAPGRQLFAGLEWRR